MQEKKLVRVLNQLRKVGDDLEFVGAAYCLRETQVEGSDY